MTWGLDGERTIHGEASLKLPQSLDDRIVLWLVDRLTSVVLRWRRRFIFDSDYNPSSLLPCIYY